MNDLFKERSFLQVDLLRTVTLPHLQLFGISDGLELKVRHSDDVVDPGIKVPHRSENVVRRPWEAEKSSFCARSSVS